MSKRSNEKRREKKNKRKSIEKRNKAYSSFKSVPKMKSVKGGNISELCNVCNKNIQSTFDHIPPKSTRKIIRNRSHYLRNKDTDVINLGKKYKTIQKLGFQTVCGDCNNISSRRYVPGFNNMIEQLLTHINQGIDGKSVHIKINFIDVFKQLLYMFMVQNDEFKYMKYHRFFYDIFSNRNSCKFTIPDAGSYHSYHIRRLVRIYMGFYRKQDLIYHTDQVPRISLPDVSMTGNGTASLDIHFEKFFDAIRLGACENIIGFTPFLFKLCVGLDETQDTDSDKLINLSNFTTISDKEQIFELDLKEYDIDLPPASFKSSLMGHGEWNITAK